jgi:nicotinamidase-related amidase
MSLTPATTALVLIDMQNDFLHPDGAYGRAGQACAAVAALPARLKPVADAVRRTGGWIVSTHFTLVPGKDGKPFISPHLIVLSDGCAAFRDDVHDATIASLGSISDIATCADVISAL